MRDLIAFTGRTGLAGIRLLLVGTLVAALVLCLLDWLLFTVKAYDNGLEGVATSMPITRLGTLALLILAMAALWRRATDAGRGRFLVAVGGLVGVLLWFALILDLFGVSRAGRIDLNAADALASPFLLWLTYLLAIAVPAVPFAVASPLLSAPSEEVKP